MSLVRKCHSFKEKHPEGKKNGYNKNELMGETVVKKENEKD